MKWRTVFGVFTLTMVLGPLGAAAQEVARSLDELRRSGILTRGDAVYVTDDTGRRMKGRIGDLTSTSLVVTDGHETWALADIAVRTIERQDSLKNGILIGMGVGTAIAVGFFPKYAYESVYFSYSSIAVGAIFGAIVDASRRKTLYRGPHSVRLTLSPMLSKEGTGLLASLTW